MVTDGMEKFLTLHNTTVTIHLNELGDIHPKTYARNNLVIAFVDEEGTFFVIPDLEGVEETLLESGYRKKSFNVPFSNDEIPVAAKEHWEKLWDDCF